MTDLQIQPTDSQSKQREETHISKAVSYYLRHHPEELNLVLDPEGWVNLDDFLVQFNQKYQKSQEERGQQSLDEAKLQEILAKSEKKRWQIENGQIRATYGHTVTDLELKYPLLEENTTLFHGTTNKNLVKIKKEGLLPMKRLFVHLTSDPVLARTTAERKGGEVSVLEIKTAQLREKESIYVAGNGIYLVKKVAPEFLLF